MIWDNPSLKILNKNNINNESETSKNESERSNNEDENLKSVDMSIGPNCITMGSMSDTNKKIARMSFYLQSFNYTSS